MANKFLDRLFLPDRFILLALLVIEAGDSRDSGLVSRTESFIKDLFNLYERYPNKLEQLDYIKIEKNGEKTKIQLTPKGVTTAKKLSYLQRDPKRMNDYDLLNTLGGVLNHISCNKANLQEKTMEILTELCPVKEDKRSKWLSDKLS